MSSRKATITDEHREESRRLKEIWERERSKRGFTQQSFAEEFEVGTQGAVWQCLNGSGMPISLKAARGFARGLGVDISAFSPRLAAEAAKNAEFAPAADDDFVDVSRVNVKLAAGHGTADEIEETVGSLKFSRSFLRNIGVSPASARVVEVRGPSMEPTIRDGAVLLVSTANREPRNDTIFALARPTEGLVVKRLVRLGRDQWVARSDNREFADIPIGHGEPVTIIGRAHWMGVKL